MPWREVPEAEVRHAVLIEADRWLVPISAARYVNHGCAPNCTVGDDLEVITTGAVAAGAELTISYNTATLSDWVEDPAAHFWDPRWSFDCRCGARGCVGRVDRYRVIGADGASAPGPVGKLQVGISAGRGRGVFAAAPIAAGETFERSPVIVSPAAEWPALERTVFYHHTFAWGPAMEHAAVALGYGSLFNHAYTPNARFDLRLDELRIDFSALRDIAVGEEILVNYNGEPGDRSPLWFEVC